MKMTTAAAALEMPFCSGRSFLLSVSGIPLTENISAVTSSSCSENIKLCTEIKASSFAQIAENKSKQAFVYIKACFHSGEISWTRPHAKFAVYIEGG